MHVPLLDHPEEELRDVLWEYYLLPVANWLIGPPSFNCVLAQTNGSAWESALTVWFLLDLLELDERRQVRDTDALDRRLIESKVHATMQWICDQCAPASSDRPHWEGVTWDTAVCVRTVARVLSSDPSALREDQAENVLEKCAFAVKWLANSFSAWDEQVTFPFGPSDLAQIVSTLVYLIESDSPILTAAFGGSDRARKHVDQIAVYLAKARDDMSTPDDSDLDDEAAASVHHHAFWGDFFQSGEVIDALASYVHLCTTRGEEDDASEEAVRDCERRTVDCLQYFETTQNDGRWGTHGDTCRAMYAYLRASSLLKDVGQEDHVVLKCLRWMCDDKQVFSDGSFMHTMFITVFYAHALLQVYAHWKPAERSVIDVYDYAIWSSPVRSTPERAKRLALEVDSERSRRAVKRSRQLTRRAYAACAFLVTVSLTFVYAFVAHDASWQITTGTALSLAGIAFAVASAVAGIVVKWPFSRKSAK
jgi:hypothetical protein